MRFAVEAREVPRRHLQPYTVTSAEQVADMGVSLKQYQTEVRIRRACEPLRSSDKPAKSIAGYLAYNTPYHFSAQFRRRPVWRHRRGVSATG